MTHLAIQEYTCPETGALFRRVVSKWTRVWSCKEWRLQADFLWITHVCVCVLYAWIDMTAGSIMWPSGGKSIWSLWSAHFKIQLWKKRKHFWNAERATWSRGSLVKKVERCSLLKLWCTCCCQIVHLWPHYNFETACFLPTWWTLQSLI